MSQRGSTARRLKLAGRAVKGIVFAVMVFLWIVFWSLIVYSDIEAGNLQAGIVVAVLLVLLPVGVLLRQTVGQGDSSRIGDG